MRLTTRKKLAELKRCQLAGGSPPPGIELNQEDTDIIDIVGTEYFYEEMNGELKPENFMSGFDYVPEHFCDAILTAAAVSSGQQPPAHQMQSQHQKDQQQQHVVGGQQQDHHDSGETNDAAGGSSNHNDSHTGGGSFQSGVGGPQMQGHNGEHAAGSGQQQQHQTMPHHPAFHGGLHPHLLRRQHAAAAMQRESAFEEKLLQFMQDAFPKKAKKRKSRDPDKLFLLSLYEEIKRVPEEIRLDVKAELIQVLKKYQKKSPVKQEKSLQHSGSSSSSASGTSKDKILPSHTQLSHSMYNLQKKYDKSEKDAASPSHVDQIQEQVRVAASFTTAMHASQHSLLHLQKKYEESGADKVLDQRKHVVEAAAHQQHQQQQQQQQPPPPQPPSNEQHLHHPQLPQNIMFPPLSQIRNEQQQPNGQQHHGQHNPHQQQQQSQHPHQQAVQQHHPPTIFGAASSASSMSTDRPPMRYENVG